MVDPGAACARAKTRRTLLYVVSPRDPQRHLLSSASGETWHLLPHDFPPWQTVYHYARLWRLMAHRNGSTARFVSKLVVQLHALPSLPPPFSTANRSRRLKGGFRGRDGYKRVTGRKRHLLVDTTGLILKVVVHAANLSDTKGVASSSTACVSSSRACASCGSTKPIKDGTATGSRLSATWMLPCSRKDHTRATKRRSKKARRDERLALAPRWRNDVGWWNGHLPG